MLGRICDLKRSEVNGHLGVIDFLVKVVKNSHCNHILYFLGTWTHCSLGRVALLTFTRIELKVMYESLMFWLKF